MKCFDTEYDSQDEWCVDVDEIRKEVDKEFVDDARDESF